MHCGFCNATCPTYQLLGDELDGPRGRIYLIKELLETGSGQTITARHLDRCLTCRSCETTCPSGVAYGELLEIGRECLEPELQRGLPATLTRHALLGVVPNPARFRLALQLGRLFGWLLPERLRGHIPARDTRQPEPAIPVEAGRCKGRVLLLEGCVQQVSTPRVNTALRRLLATRGIEAVRLDGESCCGSLALHLGHRRRAEASMQQNLSAISTVLPSVDAVISTASGCGVTLKDYPRLLADDTRHVQTLERLTGKLVDASEYLSRLDTHWIKKQDFTRVAWHAPCTLQHGQRVTGVVERILTRAGYELVPVNDPHLCCGSAGTYSLLQADISEQLRRQKLKELTQHAPDVIATANVGCQLHLEGATSTPVLHWLELIS